MDKKVENALPLLAINKQLKMERAAIKYGYSINTDNIHTEKKLYLTLAEATHKDKPNAFIEIDNIHRQPTYKTTLEVTHKMLYTLNKVNIGIHITHTAIDSIKSICNPIQTNIIMSVKDLIILGGIIAQSNTIIIIGSVAGAVSKIYTKDFLGAFLEVGYGSVFTMGVAGLAHTPILFSYV